MTFNLFARRVAAIVIGVPFMILAFLLMLFWSPIALLVYWMTGTRHPFSEVGAVLVEHWTEGFPAIWSGRRD